MISEQVQITTTPGQSEPGTNGQEQILHVSRTGASPSNAV